MSDVLVYHRINSCVRKYCMELLAGCALINNNNKLEVPDHYTCESRAIVIRGSRPNTQLMEDQIRAAVESFKNALVEEPSGYFLEREHRLAYNDPTGDVNSRTRCYTRTVEISVWARWK